MGFCGLVASATEEGRWGPEPLSCVSERGGEGWRKKNAEREGVQRQGEKRRETGDFIKWVCFKIRAGWDPVV